MTEGRRAFVVLAVLSPVLLVAFNERFAIIYSICLSAMACISSTVNDPNGFTREEPTLRKVLLYSGVKFMNLVTFLMMGMIVGLGYIKQETHDFYFMGIRLLVFLAACYLAISLYRVSRTRIAHLMAVVSVLFIPFHSASLSQIPWPYAYFAVGILYSVFLYRGTVSHQYEV